MPSVVNDFADPRRNDCVSIERLDRFVTYHRKEPTSNLYQHNSFGKYSRVVPIKMKLNLGMRKCGIILNRPSQARRVPTARTKFANIYCGLSIFKSNWAQNGNSMNDISHSTHLKD